MAGFKLTGKHFYHLMQSALRRGGGIQINLRGHGQSMSPFIKDNSVLTLEPLNDHHRIKFGDVVAVADRAKGQILIHRVVGARKSRYQVKGDNCLDMDGWYDGRDIVGIVREVSGNGLSPYSGKRWENVLIGLGSKTGLLSHLFLPVYRLARGVFRR